jgi:serine/threonine protein kinase
LVHGGLTGSAIIFVDGKPKLGGFDLVRNVSEPPASLVGPGAQATPQADLYSLGQVLYQASTWKDWRAFPEWPGDVQEKSEREELLEFNEVVLKACETKPSRRYQSAKEMHTDLLQLKAGRSVRRRRWRECR